MRKATIQPSRGWASDQPFEAIPPTFMTLVQDAFNQDGAIGRSLAYAPVLETLNAAPRYLIPNQDIGSEAYWLFAGNTAVGVVSAAGEKVITPAAFGDHTLLSQPFSGGIINQLPVLNSPVSGPWYWDQDFLTPSLLQALPGWPAADTCQVMRPFREFLIAMDITVSGTRFPDLLRWSDAAAPGQVPQSWTAAPTSQAGEVSVSFNPGELIDGAQMVDRFLAYKGTSVYQFTLVGGAFVFDNRPIFSTFGCLARGCIAEWRGQHYVLTDGDLVVHDGVNVQSIIDNRVRREIFDNLDGDNFANSFIALDKARHLLYICRPRTTETFPSEAIVINLDDLSIGHQSLINTSGTPHLTEGVIDTSDSVERNWDEKTTTWSSDPTRWDAAAFSRIQNEMLMADFGATQLQQLGLGDDHNGTPIASQIEREGLTLGDPHRRKYISRVFPRFYGGTGNTVYISIGVQQTPDTPTTWGAEQAFIIGESRSVAVDQAGFYVGYRFRTEEGTAWQLPSHDLLFEFMGEY